MEDLTVVSHSFSNPIFVFQFLSMAHVRYYSPVPAILLSLFLGSTMLLSSNFDVLVTACLFTNWGFRGLAFIGLLHLRNKRKDLNRPYKVCNALKKILILIAPSRFQAAVLD